MDEMLLFQIKIYVTNKAAHLRAPFKLIPERYETKSPAPIQDSGHTECCILPQRPSGE